MGLRAAGCFHHRQAAGAQHHTQELLLGRLVSLTTHYPSTRQGSLVEATLFYLWSDSLKEKKKDHEFSFNVGGCNSHAFAPKILIHCKNEFSLIHFTME